MEKPGIDKIQLPPSTKKIGPSRTNASSSCRDICLVVAGAGIHPTKTNVYIENILSGRKEPPKSFVPKNISPMLKTLWRTVGVPRDVVDVYAESSHQPCGVGLEHACVVGVPDPIDAIPYGYVFVSGLLRGEEQNKIDEIFVSRFPCTAASDARMLPLLTEQPKGMSTSDWDFLNTLDFGSIIFGNPENTNQPPLAPTIASGDCDGDFYLICWNREIMSHCRVPRTIHVPRGTDNISSNSQQISSYNPNWFEECRLNFFNLHLMMEIHQLIKALYGAWKNESSKEHPNGEHAEAFGEAFKKSLDMEKQGTKPYLPRFLWKFINEGLHHLLRDNPSVSEDLFLAENRQSHEQDKSEHSSTAASSLQDKASNNNARLITPVLRGNLETILPLRVRSSNASTTAKTTPDFLVSNNYPVVSDSESDMDDDYMSIDSESDCESDSFYDASEGIRDIFDVFEVLD